MEGGFSSIVPGPAPSKQKSSKSGFLGGGRKLVPSKTSNPPQEQKPKPRRQHTTLEELDRMLEDDALGLLNMKKEMQQNQDVELNKSLTLLADLKKEYNALKIANDEKHKSISKINDRITELTGIQHSNLALGVDYDDIFNEIRSRMEAITEHLEAEARTSKMLGLMLKRLDEEINVCRTNTSNVSLSFENSTHEYNLLQNALTQSKHELAELEKRLEKMTSTVRMRRAEREVRMEALNTIVMEGQNSYQKVLSESLEISAFQDNGMESFDTPRKSAKTPSKQSNTGFSTPGTAKPSRGWMSSNDDYDVILAILEAEDPENIKRLPLEKIQELADRYQSKELKLQRLEGMETEFRSNLALQNQRLQENIEKLNKANAKYQQIASTRQIYQEVDMKDSALASARKECDSCREREYRLRQQIESLKRSIPRFLTKLTKVQHPVPSVEQVRRISIDTID